MSSIARSIKECMQRVDIDSAGEMEAHFNFPPDFIGFKGHFPGNPILPGVCKIQAFLCVLEAAARKTPRLKEIVSAKFFSPVTCNDEIVLKARQESEGREEALAKALITRGEKKIAEIQLKIIYEG